MRTVVVGLISQKNIKAEEEFLLVKSKKDFGDFTGFYYPPGGHLKSGETEQEALVREIYEELSLVVEPLAKLASTLGDVENQTTHWWSCKVISGEIKLNKNEILDAGYFSKEQMKTMSIWPTTRKFFQI